ncbi:MAG: hypothetical protein Q7S90_02855 [Rubrivivax sp.]|nr:hypothetical protein [Rubrivivax sp.]
MIRCVALAATLLACALPAAAQMQRNFPANALRGELVVLQPPEARLNGRPARLSPGARIRGDNNLLVVSSALVDQRLVVHYTLDTSGHLQEIWVLAPAEIARKPWPTTAEQARSWVFDPVAQTWSRP